MIGIKPFRTTNEGGGGLGSLIGKGLGALAGVAATVASGGAAAPAAGGLLGGALTGSGLGGALGGSFGDQIDPSSVKDTPTVAPGEGGAVGRKLVQESQN